MNGKRSRGIAAAGAIASAPALAVQEFIRSALTRRASLCEHLVKHNHAYGLACQIIGRAARNGLKRNVLPSGGAPPGRYLLASRWWLCLGLVIAAVATRAAVADSIPRQPIDIRSFRTQTDRLPRQGTGKLTAVISFSVRDARAADQIRFTIVMPDGVVRTFTARGLFSHDVLIDNSYLPADDVIDSPPLARNRRDRCVATFVHFIDGTTLNADL
jgi:hypothetical protein